MISSHNEFDILKKENLACPVDSTNLCHMMYLLVCFYHDNLNVIHMIVAELSQ